MASLPSAFLHGVTGLVLIYRAQLREYFRPGVVPQSLTGRILLNNQRGGAIAGNTSQYLGRRLTIMYVACMHD